MEVWFQRSVHRQTDETRPTNRLETGRQTHSSHQTKNTPVKLACSSKSGKNISAENTIHCTARWARHQGLYKSSITNFQQISRIHFFKNSRRISHDKPYNIKMQVKLLMSINDATR